MRRFYTLRVTHGKMHRGQYQGGWPLTEVKLYILEEVDPVFQLGDLTIISHSNSGQLCEIAQEHYNWVIIRPKSLSSSSLNLPVDKSVSCWRAHSATIFEAISTSKFWAFRVYREARSSCKKKKVHRCWHTNQPFTATLTMGNYPWLPVKLSFYPSDTWNIWYICSFMSTLWPETIWQDSNPV